MLRRPPAPERVAGRGTVALPGTRMQAGRLSWHVHQFLARRSDTAVVGWLRQLAEDAVALLHSENHDPQTNGEHRVIDVLSPWLRTAVDVGANRGEWTAYVLQRCPDTTVYCFELSEPTRATLRARFGQHANVKILECGLADRADVVAVKHYLSDDRLTSLFDYPHPRHAEIRHERVERGDDVLDAEGVEQVDLLKIDSEGADLAVLRGFERFLSRAAIRAIQFEYGFACVLARAFLLDFYELLGSYGYVVGRVRSTHVAFEPYRLESENFFGPNFIAVHRSAPEWMERLAQRSPRRAGGAAWKR